jgi:hypothetical protein
LAKVKHFVTNKRVQSVNKETTELQQQLFDRHKKFMKKITKLSAVFLAAAVFAACSAFAQPTPAASGTAPTTNTPPPKARAAGYRGTIASVDTATMTLSLKGRPGNPETKVKLTHDTKIKKDGQPAQFTDLVEGLKISGSGKKGEDGVWTANTLNIVTKQPTPKSPTGGAASTKPPE